MKLPNVSMLVSLSVLSSGVPVNPMNIAPGRSCFMAACIVPDCVRCALSTKTNKLLLARSLGLPVDAAFALGHPRLRRMDAEVFIMTGRLLVVRVEHHEVMDQLKPPFLQAQLTKSPIDRLFDV